MGVKSGLCGGEFISPGDQFARENLMNLRRDLLDVCASFCLTYVLWL